MAYSAAVITVSDKGFDGERIDTSGPAVGEMLKEKGYRVVHTSVVPDDLEMIKKELCVCADEKEISLVLTTGGTGFSPRDVTPEATLAVIEKETRGIPEAMRAESMRITPRGCLSRSAAGIRGKSLIVNLPGSKKAAVENLQAVLPALEHGLKMLLSQGSADCAAPERGQEAEGSPAMSEGSFEDPPIEKETPPSIDEWLREAKAAPEAAKCGMFLVHSGVVRESARAKVREKKADAADVAGMEFSFDAQKKAAAEEEARQMEGIYYVRAWLNRGRLAVGDDIMAVLIGGDIRPHVVEALQFLVGKIKNECVVEREIYRS